VSYTAAGGESESLGWLGNRRQGRTGPAQPPSRGV